MKSAVSRWLIAPALALVAAGAHAQEQPAAERGWYGGFSAGQSRIDFANSNVAPVPFATQGTLVENDTDFAYKLFVGYRLQRHLALEFGYTNFGHFSATRTVTAPAAGSRTFSMTVDGFHFDVVGIVPVSSNFELFGKIGIIRTTTKIDNSVTGAVVLNSPAKQEEVNIDPVRLGIGAEFRFSRAVGLRVEYERQRIDWEIFSENPTVSLLSAGLVFRF